MAWGGQLNCRSLWTRSHNEAFVQAYVSRGMNGTKAYRAVYPSIKSDDVAGAAAARLLGNVRVQARIAEIMRAGAERAEVTVEQVVRELKLIGFSDIRKVVSWRNELVTRTEKGGAISECSTIR